MNINWGEFLDIAEDSAETVQEKWKKKEEAQTRQKPQPLKQNKINKSQLEEC